MSDSQPHAGGELERLRGLIDQAIAEADWVVVIQALCKKAEAGDVRAFRTLAEYRFGLPHRAKTETPAPTGGITVYLPEIGSIDEWLAQVAPTRRASGNVPSLPRGRDPVRRSSGRGQVGKPAG